MMWKKIGVTLLGLVIACGALLGVAGCGRDPEEDPNKINIRIWCQLTQYDYFTWVKQAFEAENEDINLIITKKGNDALGDSLDVTLANADAPDITATWGGLVASKLVAGNKIANLSDVVTAEVEQNLVEGATYNKIDGNGVYYSVPLQGFASPVIFYNKTLFAKNGWSMPTTYEAFKTLAASVRTKNLEPLIAGFNTWHLPHFMQAVHARTMTPENYAKTIGFDSEDPFDNDQFAAGWTFLKKMSDDGIFATNITGYDAGGALNSFVAQRSAMVTAPSSDLALLAESTTFEIGSFPLPPAPADILQAAGVTAEEMADAPLVSGVYSDVLVLNAQSTKQDAAKKLLRFVLTTAAQEKLLDYQLFPVRSDVSLDNADPQLAGVLQYMNRGVSGFYQSYSVPSMDIQLLNVGGSVLGGNLTPAQAAKDIAKYYRENRS